MRAAFGKITAAAEVIYPRYDTGVSPRAFLVSLGAPLYEKHGPNIFDRPDPGEIEVHAGWTKDEAAVVGRFVDRSFTLPFLPAPKRKVKVKVLAATGKSQVLGERIRSLVDVTEAMEELTLIHAFLSDPARRLIEGCENCATGFSLGSAGALSADGWARLRERTGRDGRSDH